MKKGPNSKFKGRTRLLSIYKRGFKWKEANKK
jgi:hypothetical protein